MFGLRPYFIPILLVITLIFAGCSVSSDNEKTLQIADSKPIKRTLLQEIEGKITNPSYILNSDQFRIDENDTLIKNAEDEKSVFVEKVISPTEIIISFITIIDGNTVMKLEKVRLAGLSGDLSECEKSLVLIKMKETMEHQYVYFDSDNIHPQNKYVLIWAEDIHEPEIKKLFLDKSGQDLVQLNFALSRVGYAKVIHQPFKSEGQGYDLVQEFEQNERVAQTLKRGIWEMCGV